MIWCNLPISVKTRHDMDISETTTVTTRSDMNAAVDTKTSKGKSLEMLPQFTIKEIEQHRLLSGKTPESGKKFKTQNITSDSIFTKYAKGIFYVKGFRKASMKKGKHPVAVKLNTIAKLLMAAALAQLRKVGIVIMCWCCYFSYMVIMWSVSICSRRNHLHKQAPPMKCAWRNHAKSTSNGNCCSKITKL